MITAVVVGVFGVAGALLRFGVDSLFIHHLGQRKHWPWATLTINAVGSAVIGLAAAWGTRSGFSPELHAGLAAGLAGGLTTFSSWTVATVKLWDERRHAAAFGNVLLNLALGLSAAWLGLSLGA